MIKSNNKSAEKNILNYYQTIENVEALHREMRMLKSEKGNKTRTFRLFDEEGNQVKYKGRSKKKWLWIGEVGGRKSEKGVEKMKEGGRWGERMKEGGGRREKGW